MTPAQESCLKSIYQQTIPDIEMAGMQLAIKDKPGSAFGRSIRSLNEYRQQLVGYLRKVGVLSSKPIHERSIRACRLVRCVRAAGLHKPVTDNNLPAKQQLALELWKLDPLQYSHWCLSNNLPIEESFLMSEMLPWLMESFHDQGVNRNCAADLALEMIQLLNFYELPPVQNRDQALDLLANWDSGDSGDEALAEYLHNQITNHPEWSLSQIQEQLKTLTESDQDYLRSHIGKYSISEKLDLLRGCIHELSDRNKQTSKLFRKPVAAVDLLSLVSRSQESKTETAATNFLFEFDPQDPVRNVPP